MKKLLLLSLCCSLISVSAADNAGISTEDVKSLNADMKATQPVTAGNLLRNDFEEFRKERGIESYGTPNAKGTVYFTGEASVAVNVNNADFIKSRSMAYQKAYQDAVAQLIMDRVGKEMYHYLELHNSLRSLEKFSK